jgi:integrase
MRKPGKDYKLPPRPTHLSDAVRPADFIVNFLGPTGALVQTLDFSDHMGRPRLVADLAFALRHHLADKSRDTRQNVRTHLHRLLEFLDQHDPSRTRVLAALDVDGGTLRAYVAWLGSRSMTKGTRANIWSALKAPLTWLLRHRPDLVQPGLELPFNAFPHRSQGVRPRTALAREEIEAVLAACRREIEASWADFNRGRELLAAGGLRMAAIGKPMPRDLSDLGVLLAVVAQRHDGLLPEDGELLAGDTLSRRVRGAVTDHGGAERVSRFLHTTPESIFPYMVAIAAQSFANPEALRNMRRGCMTEDPLIERRVHVDWHKGRAGRVQRRSFLRDRSMSVPNLIERVLALTAPLLPHAAPEDRDKLFLAVIRHGPSRSPRRVALASFRPEFVQRFVARHSLLDRQGKPLHFTPASLRPTGLTHAHAALGQDVVKTQVLANHATPEQTRHYVSQPVIQAEQVAGLARLQGSFVEAVRRGGGFTKQGSREVGAPEEVIDGSNATASGFICRDPLAGVAPGQRKGKLCTAWLGCFTCRNAVIPREAQTLARILRVRKTLVEARPSMALDRWQLLYAPQLEIIERDILPAFSADVRTAAEVMMDRLPPLSPIE